MSEEIREEVARIITAELKDPRIGFVTVTRVNLTPDLRLARVHVGVLGDEAQRAKTLAGLRQAAGFVRRALGRRVRMRHTPEVAFHLDEGLDATERVARLLEEARRGEVSGKSLDEPSEPEGSQGPARSQEPEE